MQDFLAERTTTADKNFEFLVRCLDHELWNELKEDQATYDQYNKVPGLKTAVVIYADEKAIACGCFKEFNTNTVEIKRMFVQNDYRGKGVAKKLLQELEAWAIENGYHHAVLETSVHFSTAINLYQNNGYKVIPNYGQYEGLDESICMKKLLKE